MVVKKNCFCVFSILMFGKEAICPDGLFVPTVFQESDFYLNSLTYVLRVQYSCGIVLVFWFWREIVFGVRYVLSVQYSCAVVPVFLVVAGNSSQNENTF